MNIAEYLSRQYADPPCWLLVTDVYQAELGEGVLAFKTVDPSVRAIASAFRLALHKSAHGFERLNGPREFAVVLMGKSATLGLHHCGIYYQGNVLHALTSGVVYQDMATLGDAYRVIEYWGKPGVPA